MSEVHMEDLPRGPRSEISENAGLRFDTVLALITSSFEAAMNTEAAYQVQAEVEMQAVNPQYQETMARYEQFAQQQRKPVDEDETFLVKEIGNHARWDGRRAPDVAPTPVATDRQFGDGLRTRAEPLIAEYADTSAPQASGFTEIGPNDNVLAQSSNEVYMNVLQSEPSAVDVDSPQARQQLENGLDIEAIREQVRQATNRDNLVRGDM